MDKTFTPKSVADWRAWLEKNHLKETRVQLIKYKKHNLTVHFWKTINGNMIEYATQKAMFQSLGLAGDYWLKTIKNKYLVKPRYEYKQGHYNYFEKEDGEFINFKFRDLNRDLKEAKSYFLDEDMRLTRIAIQKNLKDRLDTQGFWSKYGLVIGIGILIVMQGIFGIMEIKALGKVSDGLQSASQTFDRAAKMNEDAMNRVTATTSSGLVPANYEGVKSI